MKKTLSSVVLVSAVFSMNAGFAAQAPFPTGPALEQAYHSQSDTTSSPQQSIQQSVPSNPTTPDSVQNTQNTTGDDPAYLNSAAVDSTQQVAFQQQANARIQNLMASNQAIAVAIQNIDQQIASLQQQMKVMQKQQMVDERAESGWQSFLNTLNHNDLLLYANIIIAALFIMGFGLMMGRRRTRKPIFAGNATMGKTDALDDDTKSEYDFMGTKEAIPAQLDLARSYIAMGDHAQAKSILKIVIDNGDREQSFEAKLMMEKLK